MNRLFAFLLACVFAQFSYGQKDCVRGLVPDILAILKVVGAVG